MHYIHIKTVAIQLPCLVFLAKLYMQRLQVVTVRAVLGTCNHYMTDILNVCIAINFTTHIPAKFLCVATII